MAFDSTLHMIMSSLSFCLIKFNCRTEDTRATHTGLPKYNCTCTYTSWCNWPTGQILLSTLLVMLGRPKGPRYSNYGLRF